MTVGTEVAEALDVHEGRSAARCLLAALFDAWDAGDAAAFVACFAPGGTWTDSGLAAEPAATLAAQFAARREVEPWSVHWLSNEQIVPGDTGPRGAWLWSAASTIEGGAAAAWSGGDLEADLVHTDAGWRIAHLATTARYRTPYGDGWLRVPLAALGDGAGAPTAHRGLDTPAPPAPAVPGHDTEEARWRALADERSVANLVGDYVDTVELGGSDVAAWWTGAGHATIDGGTVSGPAAIAAAHRSDMASWIRVTTSVATDVAGDRATCRWRDLWTAEAGGMARWRAHAYVADVIRTDRGWRFATLRRDTLIDCPYDGGWMEQHLHGSTHGSDAR